MSGADHYVIEYQANLGAVSVAIDRVVQPSIGPAVHTTAFDIPGASGGMLHVYGIVAGKAVNIGSRTLP
jgi:hypothetical protein